MRGGKGQREIDEGAPKGAYVEEEKDFLTPVCPELVMFFSLFQIHLIFLSVPALILSLSLSSSLTR